MAGAGVRVFQAGEVLTAALVNTFLQDQVVARFASAAVRDAAFGAPGNLLQKPVLEEGRVCYLDSTSELQYYSGTAWVSISAEAVINQVQAKGDIVVGTGVNTISRVAVGANDTVLVADSTTPSGLAWRVATVPDNSITAGKIVDGTIVNADINASAAIDKTKISGTAVTLADTGTITSTMIADGAIVNADVNASAAIDKTKISGTAITAADTGTVTSTMITDGTIVNADINASAAIDLGKLADATIDEKSASYTLALTDKNKFIKMSVTSTANTVTVPTNTSVAFPIGSQIHIIQYGSGKTQVIPVSGTVILYATPGTYLRAQYSSATLLKCDTNIWMLMGDLSAS
jgi:hypothetical protein